MDQNEVRLKKIETEIERIDLKLEKIDLRLERLEINIKTISDNLLEIKDSLGKWKSDLFDLVDGLAVEIRDGREHRMITGHQIVENRERVESLEKKVFGAVQSGV